MEITVILIPQDGGVYKDVLYKIFNAILIFIAVTNLFGYGETKLTGNKKIYLLINLRKKRFKYQRGPNKLNQQIIQERRENICEVKTEELTGGMDSIFTM